MNHWEIAKYAKDINGIIVNYGTCQSKIERTNQMLDWFDKQNKDEIRKVLEPGCNVGRNLKLAQDRYNCKVVGYDICPETIEECNKTFKPDDKFYVKNTIGYTFDEYEDNYFDLGITMGYLMHMPQCEDKIKHIDGILRVCKQALIYEIYDPKEQCEAHGEDGFFVSRENYCRYNDNIEYTGVGWKGSLRLYFYKG